MSEFRPAPKPTPREKKKPKPPKAINAKRSADEFRRCYHSEARVLWVKSLPCVAGQAHTGIIDNAHVEGGGAGRKAGYDKIVPLCHGHHHDLHQMGIEQFEGTYYVDLAALALDTERCWRRYANT